MGDWVQSLLTSGATGSEKSVSDGTNNYIGADRNDGIPVFSDKQVASGQQYDPSSDSWGNSGEMGTQSGASQALSALMQRIQAANPGNDGMGYKGALELFTSDPKWVAQWNQQYPGSLKMVGETLNAYGRQWANKGGGGAFTDAIPLIASIAGGVMGAYFGGGASVMGDAIPSSFAGVGADTIGASIAGNTVTAGVGGGAGTVGTGAGVGSGGNVIGDFTSAGDQLLGDAAVQNANAAGANLGNPATGTGLWNSNVIGSAISGVPQTPSVTPQTPAPAPNPNIVTPGNVATAATVGTAATQVGDPNAPAPAPDPHTPGTIQVGQPDPGTPGVTGTDTAPAPDPKVGGPDVGQPGFDLETFIKEFTEGKTDWMTLAKKYGPALIGGLIGSTQNKTAPITQTPWNSQYFQPLQDQATELMKTNKLALPEVPTLQGMPDLASDKAANSYADSVVGNMNRTFTDPGGPLAAIRGDFTSNAPGGSTRQGLAEGVAASRESLNQGLVRANIMNAIYPTNLNYNSQRVQTDNANQKYGFEQNTGRNTALFNAPWQNLSQAGNIFTGAAGKGQTTVLPNTPWWQSGLGGALATQGVVNKIGP